MIKQAIIISKVAIFVTIIANIGELRCQENLNKTAEKHQLQNIRKVANNINDDNVMDDKNRVVEIIGKIIQYKLFDACQRIDSRELEDRLEKSR